MSTENETNALYPINIGKKRSDFDAFALRFKLSKPDASASIKHSQVRIACHEALKFYPPELGHLTLKSYVAQKLESTAFASASAIKWLEVFKLASKAEMPLNALPWESNCVLQLLLAVLEHTEIIVLSHNLPVDQPGAFLQRIRHFCKDLNASFQSAFVIIADELEPRWAWAVERILEVEKDGKLREWNMDL